MIPFGVRNVFKPENFDDQKLNEIIFDPENSIWKYKKSTRSFHKPTRKFRPADFTEFSNITYRQRNNTTVNGSINDGQEKTEFLSEYVTYLDWIPRIFRDLESM